MALIDAYRKDNGEKVLIPEHWLRHPILGAPFAKTPSQRARDRKPRARAVQKPRIAARETPANGDQEKE